MTTKQYQELDFCIATLYKVQAAHIGDLGTMFALEHVIATLEAMAKTGKEGCDGPRPMAVS